MASTTNLYAYCGDSAPNATDPLGRWSITWTAPGATVWTPDDTLTVQSIPGGFTWPSVPDGILAVTILRVTSDVGSFESSSHHFCFQTAEIKEYSQVYLKTSDWYKNNKINGVNVEDWVKRAEGDHVADFTTWDKDKAMHAKVVQSFKKSGEPKKWFDTRPASDDAALAQLRAIIQPLGQAAIDATIKKHDLPKDNAPHTYGSLKQRP